MQLRCPDCREAFKWDAQKAWPRFCPCCGEDINNDRDDIVMPFVSRAKNTYADTVYREMEQASEVRAEQAAEAVGATPAEMSALKITNLKDGSRPGDIAAPSVHAETRRLTAGNAHPVFAGSGGVEYGAAVQAGPHPNTGARMRTMIQSNHFNEVSKANLPTRNISSDVPARETLQPGYRRRG